MEHLQKQGVRTAYLLDVILQSCEEQCGHSQEHELIGHVVNSSLHRC